jgi:hypothetical protein
VSTDLFQALTLGLLVIVIVALLVAVSMLGRIRASLEAQARPESRDVGESGPDNAREEAAPAAFGRAPDEVRAEAAAVTNDEPAGTVETTTDEATSDAEVVEDDGDSDRPFERGGRWYFRRGGELLVYEEGTGEWAPANASTGAAESVQSHVETVVASSEPSVVDAQSGLSEEPSTERGTPVEEAMPVEVSREDAEPSTSFAGQPLAAAEEEVASLDADEATGATETPEGVATTSSDSFWRCSSCGAVNGSTATSCRMCFTPRP